MSTGSSDSPVTALAAEIQEKEQKTMEDIVGEIDCLDDRDKTSLSLARNTFDILQFERSLNELKSETAGVASVYRHLSAHMERLDQLRRRVNSRIEKINYVVFLQDSLVEAEECIAKNSFLRASKLLHRVLRPSCVAVKEKLSQNKYMKKATIMEKRLQETVQKKSLELFRAKNQNELNEMCKCYAYLNMKSAGLIIKSKLLVHKLSKTIQETFDDNRKLGMLEGTRIIFDLFAKAVEENKNEFTELFGENSIALFIKLCSVLVSEKTKKHLNFNVHSNLISLNLNEIRKDFDLIDLDRKVNEIAIVLSEFSFFEISFLDTPPNFKLESLSSKNEIEPKIFDCLLSKNQTDLKGPVLSNEYQMFKKEIFESYIFGEKGYLTKSLQKVELCFAERVDGIGNSGGNRDFLLGNSAVVDDLFYIFKRIQNRCLETHDNKAVGTIINILNSTISDKFLKLLKDSWKTFIFLENPRDVLDQIASKKTCEAFFDKAKSLCSFTENYGIFKKDFKDKTEKHELEITQKENHLIKSCLEDLEKTYHDVKTIEKKGINYLARVFYSSTLNQIDKYLEGDFCSTQREFLMEENLGCPRIAVIFSAYIGIYDVIEQRLPPKIVERITNQLSYLISKNVEKCIAKKSFNLWGGLKIDRDMRKLSQYFVKKGGVRTRKKFQRLLQIVSILQLENRSEIGSFEKYSKTINMLEKSEIEKIIRLRRLYSSSS